MSAASVMYWQSRSALVEGAALLSLQLHAVDNLCKQENFIAKEQEGYNLPQFDVLDSETLYVINSDD